MATQLIQKQRHPNVPVQIDAEPSPKKVKTRSEIELEAWKSFDHPPEFYDNLPTTNLTTKALKGLDRRTRTQYQSPPASPTGPILSSAFDSQALARFARQGGPDLRDLRGYRHPSVNHRQPVDMSPRQVSRDRAMQSRIDEPSSTPEDPVSRTTSRKTNSSYDAKLDLHLTDHLIYPVYMSRKPGLENVMSALSSRRPSLSPSEFSEADFQEFLAKDVQANNEAAVLASSISRIYGQVTCGLDCGVNVAFTNLEPITDCTIVAPKPDLYCGAQPHQLAPVIRDELDGQIVPSTTRSWPIIPNFFLEVKGPFGHPAGARLQVRHDGAIGSRAMNALKNYGNEEPEYDNHSYVFSSTYCDGHLQLFAHHVTAPTDRGYPEYHMTFLRSFSVRDSRDTFVEGAAAFRNARDLAERYRNEFIQAANMRATWGATNQQSLRTATAASNEHFLGELKPSLQQT